MINNEAVSLEYNDYQEPAPTRDLSYSITLPSDWWISQNSYTSIIIEQTKKREPIMRYIGKDDLIKFRETEDLPITNGWNVDAGDYVYKRETPPEDFKKIKKYRYYSLLGTALVVSSLVVWVFSIIAGKLTV